MPRNYLIRKLSREKVNAVNFFDLKLSANGACI